MRFANYSVSSCPQKARRGEYYTRIAEGYILGDGAILEKDPDERVQRTMALVFSKFREFGSARQVYLWFRQENIKLPKRIGKAGINFAAATPWLIGRMLKEPGLCWRLRVWSNDVRGNPGPGPQA